MIAVFLKLLNMSITAGWIVLAVMVLRLLLQKMPKQFTCTLWALVGIRLIFPFSPKSVFSLIPSAETIPETLQPGEFPEISSGVSAIDRIVNPAAKISFTHISTGRSGAEMLDILTKGAVILWLVGMCLMLCYLACSYFYLHRKMSTAYCCRTMSDRVNLWIPPLSSASYIRRFIFPTIWTKKSSIMCWPTRGPISPEKIIW